MTPFLQNPNLLLRPRLIAFLLLLLPLGSVQAQRGPQPDLGQVKGKLIDATTEEPIGFANVVVYTISDSLVTGTTTEIDGTFSFSDLPLGDYRIEMSFIGYDTENRSVELSEIERVFTIGDVTLGTGGQELDQVVVTAERAVMELGLDRKVFNVEKSVAAAGGSAEDLLRQLPSISVDLEGNISLRGSGNVRFLINGRPSGLVGSDPTTYLKSLSATNIERIEVITNPGAAYDPDGTAGIINIVLKNKRDDGFNASVNLNAGTGNKFDGSLDLNWRKGIVTTSASSGASATRAARSVIAPLAASSSSTVTASASPLPSNWARNTPSPSVPSSAFRATTNSKTAKAATTAPPTFSTALVS